MTLNIYSGTNKNKLNSLVYSRILLMFLFLLFIFNLTGCIASENKSQEPTLATEFPKEVVEDVSNTILNFETLWSGEQAYVDPKIQNELATGKYLEYWSYERLNIADEPFWLVTDSASLESIDLIEYENDYFKAEACVQRNGRKIKPDGSLIQKDSTSPLTCGVYVFIKEMHVWKLLGYLDITDPRTYEYAPDWLKEIIGKIPPK
jgi:hypothetical protein